MSLPQAIKTMIQGVSGVADTLVTYGTRNEFATLPAITYQIDSNETMTVGPSPLKKAEISIRSVAATAQQAQEIAELVEGELDTGTYNTIAFQAIVKKNSVLEESPSGYGDETVPFICVTTAEIYYKE
jgi:hypothetical protein